MSNRLHPIWLVVLVLLFPLCAVFAAGPTGKIAGKVTDRTTGEPLIGVNIVIGGTTLGASTDLDGNYAILNVPPGTYTVTASMVGYSSMRVSDVRVNIDLTTTLDFVLAEAAVELGEVIEVVAERSLVQKDLTAKTAVVDAEQLAVLPVTEISEALELQAGFVAGSLRGGRSGEVAYWIDGVPVTDGYDGSRVLSVNKNAVQEVQLVSGAFNAEYGQAMSGIVNIATREGGQKLGGTFETYIGDYVSSHTTIFPGIDDVNPIAIRNFEGSLNGPIIGDKLTFFANGRYIYFDGWLNGYRRFNPHNIALTDSTGDFRLFRDPEGKGDSSLVPMDWSERFYAQGKLSWKITSLVKLTYNYLYDNTTAKAYDRLFYYNPDGIGKSYNLSQTHILQFTHTLSSSTFYTIGASFFDRGVDYYVYEDVNDPNYVHPKLLLRDDQFSFYTGGTDLNRFQRSTRTGLVKFDLASQIDATNMVKIGAEYRKHRIFYESIALQPINAQSDINLATDSPFIQTQVLDISSNSHDRYIHNPWELSGYVQDKMEFRDLIINIGVRFDYFEPDGVVLADESDPNIYNPIKPSNIFHDSNGNGIQDPGEATKTVDERAEYWYKKASSKFQVSPRFGASFPITDRGIVHFSYGYFFQIPRFELLYQNPGFKIGTGTGNQGVIGNADLNPEQTVSGEIGIQQQLSDDIAVDITAYFRDVRGLTGTWGQEIVIFGGSATYSKYTNSDFGFVKGIVFTLTKRFTGGFGATVDYTFQVADGSSSDPQEARNAIAGGALPEVQLVPLAWDQRHTLNFTLSYNAPSWGASLIGQFGSGTPYTPRRSADITSLLTNSQTKPVFLNMDVRAYYTFELAPLRATIYARVFNLLDRLNEIGVFDDTGRAGFTTDQARTEAINPAERVNTVDQWYTISTFYSEPRRIELGFNVEF